MALHASKYEQIFQDLKQRIESGSYPAGSILPAERELAALYQVQRPTLRKALTLLLEKGYIETRQGSGSRIIYKETIPEEASSEDTALMIGFVISGDMDRQAQLYHIQVCNYLEEYFRDDHIGVLFAKTGEDGSLPEFLTSSGMLKGIILVSNIDPSVLEKIRLQGLKGLCLANDTDLFPSINYSNFAAGFDATKHLLQQGSRRIAFISGIRGSVTEKRFSGYSEALLTYGITPDPELIVDGDWSYAAGVRAAKKLLEKGLPVDAVLGSNDMTAIGCMKTLIEAGVRVPEEVRVIGIDNIPESKSCVPSLSSIAFSQKDIARTAYLFMRELLQGHAVPNEVTIPGHLIIRQTT